MDRSADPFIERALLALADAQAGGPVYDGPAYARYLRDRVRCAMTGSKLSVPKPEPAALAAAPTSTQRSSQ